MPRETKRRDGDGSGPDRGSERAAIPVPGKTTLTEQLRFKAPRAATPGAAEEAVASQGVSGPAAAFPHRSQIESLFGRPLAASAHTDDSARHASTQLGAEAFAFRG